MSIARARRAGRALASVQDHLSLVITSAFVLAALATAAAAQFDQLPWAFHPASGTAGGTGFFNATTMTLVGPNNGCTPPGTSVAYTAVAPFDGTVSVHVHYHTNDEMP